MTAKLLRWVIVLPLTIVLIVFSVANRAVVTLSLNPFDPDDATLALSGPFFVFLFTALMIGVVVGSVATRFAARRRAAARNLQSCDAVPADKALTSS